MEANINWSNHNLLIIIKLIKKMENVNNIERKIYNKKQLIIFIIVGVLLFLIGGGLGVISTMQSQPVQTKTKTVNSLSSKVISSIVTYGQVKNINGRDITLSNLGDDLTISIASNAQIFSFTNSSNGKTGVVAPTQQIVKFENIKIGDSANVVMKLLPSGQLEGSSVIILPPPTQTK